LPNRIIVPAASQEGLNANLAEHFGRAPYFVKTVPNGGEHAGGMGYTHDHILGLRPNAIVVYGMGPRGLNTFQSAGVAVLRANANTVDEVVAAYKDNKLQELTDGCEHAHHH
jgi:predicted Fe-Mo cluster-binding NifX family protein